MLRAVVDGGRGALWSDTISSWDVLDIAMVVSLLPFFFLLSSFFLFLLLLLRAPFSLFLLFLSLSSTWEAVKKDCERIRDRRRGLRRPPPSPCLFSSLLSLCYLPPFFFLLIPDTVWLIRGVAGSAMCTGGNPPPFLPLLYYPSLSKMSNPHPWLLPPSSGGK